MRADSRSVAGKGGKWRVHEATKSMAANVIGSLCNPRYTLVILTSKETYAGGSGCLFVPLATIPSGLVGLYLYNVVIVIIQLGALLVPEVEPHWPTIVR